MTITSYATLQSNVAEFLNREDLTASIPTFIQLAEASMNRKLRHWRGEVRAAATISTQYPVLPTDWLETIRLNIVGKKRLKMISHPEMMDKREREDNTAGEPRFYAHVAGGLEVFPTPDASYDAEFLYYGKLDALSDSNASNWLLDYAPDAYLYGSLLHTAPYLKDDPRLAVWGALYKDVMDSLDAESRKARHSGTGLVRR